MDIVISEFEEKANEIDEYFSFVQRTTHHKNFESRCVIPREMQKSEFLMNKINNIAQVIIKNKRNNLAHGNESFSECGRDYTLENLEEIKDESVEYMRFILTHIKEFIKDKKYLLS